MITEIQKIIGLLNIGVTNQSELNKIILRLEKIDAKLQSDNEALRNQAERAEVRVKTLEDALIMFKCCADPYCSGHSEINKALAALAEVEK